MKVATISKKTDTDNSRDLLIALHFLPELIADKICSTVGTAEIRRTKNKKYGLLIEGRTCFYLIVLNEFLGRRKNFDINKNTPAIAKILVKMHKDKNRIKKIFATVMPAGNLKYLPDYHLKATGSRVDLKKNGWVFSHGDFTIQNILADKSGRLRILDWENMGLGYPEYDLACFMRNCHDRSGQRFDGYSLMKAYQSISSNNIDPDRLLSYLKLFAQASKTKL